MIPHVSDTYIAGYVNGRRLNWTEQPLIDNLANMENEHPPWGNEIGLRLAGYVIGFCDGWHGIEPVYK